MVEKVRRRLWEDSADHRDGTFRRSVDANLTMLPQCASPPSHHLENKILCVQQTFRPAGVLIVGNDNEEPRMVLFQIFGRVAFIVTAFIHLYFNDLIKGAITIVTMCLSDSKRPILQSILRLHSVVLGCLVLAFCFNSVSAFPGQVILGKGRDVLNFDDLDTPNGFGNIVSGYHGFVFNNLYAFEPNHPALEGIISTDDLNCAVSKPNALYGSKVTKASPSLEVRNSSQSFAVRSLKIKPLDLPVGFVTINLEGVTSNKSATHLKWSVDFPAGFHDVLHVRLEEFSKIAWRGLTRMVVWAEFHYNDVDMDDWEFCIDDFEIEIEQAS